MKTVSDVAPSVERMHPIGNDQRNYIEHLARYDFAKQFVKNGMSVLDAACGMGYGSYLLATMGCRVTGVDVSSDALDHARNHYSHNGLSYTKSDCRNLDFPDEFFDVYISFETIEHFLEQDQYLREAKRVLKKGGVFICSTPNKDIHELNRKKGWMGPNPYHLKELTVDEFRSLTGAHFSEVKYYGQDYDPLALKLREMERIISELRWEIDRLPATLAKRMLPHFARKWLGSKGAQRSQSMADGYTLDMVKIIKTNIDSADTIIAVCRT